MRRILYIDMDAFFAAVEVLRHPELAGKPLVIGGRGDPTARGVVSTASYEARKFGIHSAMPLRLAYRLCPQAIFVPVDYDAYARVSAQIKAILRTFSPAMEDVGIDEAYLDLTASGRPVDEVAREIKQRVREATGLICSVGIAPNKLLAKIASDLHKPDGLTVIAKGDVKTHAAGAQDSRGGAGHRTAFAPARHRNDRPARGAAAGGICCGIRPGAWRLPASGGALGAQVAQP